MQDQPGSPEAEAARNSAQAAALGALAVMLVDVRCRAQLLVADPKLARILACAEPLEGYADQAAEARRIASSKALAAAVQRDSYVRESLVRTGQLLAVIELLDTSGVASATVRFCAASALATLVLDDAVMDIVRERGEAAQLFVQSISVLQRCLRTLGPDAPELPQAEVELTVRMAEAVAQAMWGAAYYTTKPAATATAAGNCKDGDIVGRHVAALGEMGVATWTNKKHALGRVAHCIAATLASLSSHAESAASLMAADKEHGIVATLMLLVKVYDRGLFEHSGHVRAAAACALSFLACHNMDSKGDECLVGPYRPALLKAGALVRCSRVTSSGPGMLFCAVYMPVAATMSCMCIVPSCGCALSQTSSARLNGCSVQECLLQAALSPPHDARCRAVVEMAASVGVMYLSTMAGDLEPPPLVMLATLLNNNYNLLMVENLMAAVWTLLRNPHNRKILATAFQDNPVLSATLRDQMQVCRTHVTTARCQIGCVSP